MCHHFYQPAFWLFSDLAWSDQAGVFQRVPFCSEQGEADQQEGAQMRVTGTEEELKACGKRNSQPAFLEKHSCRELDIWKGCYVTENSRPPSWCLRGRTTAGSRVWVTTWIHSCLETSDVKASRCTALILAMPEVSKLQNQPFGTWHSAPHCRGRHGLADLHALFRVVETFTSNHLGVTCTLW